MAVMRGSPLTVAGAARALTRFPFESSLEEPVAIAINTESGGYGKSSLRGRPKLLLQRNSNSTWPLSNSLRALVDGGHFAGLVSRKT